MTVATAIRVRLLAISAVTTLVGQRVYTLVIPQSLDTFPAIRVQRIDDDEPMHMRGSAGLLRARVQVDAIAREEGGVDAYGSAVAVDAALHGPGDGSGLCGWQGVVTQGADSMEITGIVPVDVRDQYELGEQRFYKVMRDYWVFHRM